MYGTGLPTHSLPPYTTTMVPPYDLPVSQPYPSTFSGSHTMQPIVVPTPVGVPVPQLVPVPVDRPCALPVPQPVPYPVDRPCAVPVPVPVSVPQPVAVAQPFVVREPVPVPFPVSASVPVAQPWQYSVQEECCIPSSCRRVEYIIEEPVRIIRCRRRRRRRCRSYCYDPAPVAPIIVPISIPALAPQQVPSYQVAEYVQDIYPPAQVFTEQVPVGYTVNNSVTERPGIVQSQSHPGIVLPSSTGVQRQLVQQLPTGQIVQRPLSVGGSGGVQHVILQQPNVSPSNSGTVFSTSSFGTQFLS